MLRRRFRQLIPVLLCLFTGVTQAFTYVPMTDEALMAQSPVVVLGQIVSASDAAVTGGPVTRYQLAIEQVLKGEVSTNQITVQSPGARGPASNTHWFPGMPRLEEGEIVLLFLSPQEGGSYGIMQLGLGVFTLHRDAAGKPVFTRELANALRLDVAAPLANAVAEVPRDADVMLSQLGGEPQAAALLANQRVTANYTLISVPPSRWFEFDQGQDVPFQMHSSGQPRMANGGEAEIRRALNAWNNDADSNIRYRFAGRNNATAGFASNDGLNTILFGDPNNEVEGSFNCTDGGVLAAGGFVSSVGTRTYRGTTFSEIQEADIITNDGAGCFFASAAGKNGEEIFGHELGHTLGLGHSCGESDLIVIDDCTLASPEEEDALMRAYPHADGRGSRLSADDRAGILFLYEDTGTTPVDGGGGGGGGGTKKSSGGGGGGCSVAGTGTVDPTLWLLGLFALAYIARRRRWIEL